MRQRAESENLQRRWELCVTPFCSALVVYQDIKRNDLAADNYASNLGCPIFFEGSPGHC